MTTLAKPAAKDATNEAGGHRDSADTSGELGKPEASEPDHVVQFYATDDFLIEQVRGFIGEGLRTGDACIVIATAAHRARLTRRLLAEGLDMYAARKQGAYLSRDAAATLAHFMVDGSPDAKHFTQLIGGAIARAAHGSQRQPHPPRPVRVFGEMVALLWAEGNQEAAIRLEELWNDLQKRDESPRFSLVCAYPMPGFEGKASEGSFTAICRQHTHVIPDERYTMLADADERLRAITLLQQRSSSFDAEMASRKQAEERLRISEDLYRHLFETSTDGILIANPDSQTIIKTNPATADFLGYTQEELLGRTLWQVGLFPDRARALEVWRELDEQQVVHREILADHSRDRQPRYLEFVGSRFSVERHDIIQCYLRDISERKQAEEAQKALEQRKDAFISMASHELKTPITSLKAFTQILQRRMRQQPLADGQPLAILDRMDAQINRLTQLISELLDISRMQVGILAFHETSFDLDELVRETVENVQPTANTHQIQLQGATLAQIFGDRDRLGQVFINLLTNAIKFSPLADTVFVRLRGDHEWAEVIVRDVGIGIAPEHQERVFERFYQVSDSQMANTYPGLGIGLNIARTIVERHGGRLWLESRVGVGSSFHVSLSRCRKDGDNTHPFLQIESAKTP